MLVDSKTTGYYYSGFGYNSIGTSGLFSANATGTYFPLTYPATTLAGESVQGEIIFRASLSGGGTANRVNYQGKGAHYNANWEVADFSGTSPVVAAGFPISIYTSAGTLTGTAYITQYVP